MKTEVEIEDDKNLNMQTLMAFLSITGRVKKDREVSSGIDSLNWRKPWHLTSLAQSSIQSFFGLLQVASRHAFVVGMQRNMVIHGVNGLF